MNGMNEINHMDLVTRRDLESLLQNDEGPCISIFMPTHRVGPDFRQDPIRLKNLLGQAEEELVEQGMRRPHAGDLLAPARQLLDDHRFWRFQNDGLALYVAPKHFSTYRLPISLDDLVVVADRFHVKPVLSLLTGDGQFYVLALSQGGVRLLQGTRFTVSQVELEDVPQSLAETLRFDDPERQLQFHTGTGPRRNGRRGAIFHGHGVGDEDSKEDILRFFRQLDGGLNDLLGGEQAPLVLAGVDHLLPLYREANSYPHLVEGAVSGNPGDLNAKELHAQAWEVLEELLNEDLEQASATYHQMEGTGKASHRLDEVVLAAHQGRVGTLFVGLGEQRWGRVDDQGNVVELHEEHEIGDDDLLDLAAARTLLTSGRVFAVDAEEIPADGPVAAIYRY